MGPADLAPLLDLDERRMLIRPDVHAGGPQLVQEVQDRLVPGQRAHAPAATVEGADAKSLRDTLDQLKGKFKSAAIVLGSTDGGKVTLIAGVTSDLTGKIKAGDLVNHVATQVGGKGGGRPDMAQAGGSLPEKLPAARMLTK